jgi:hypothetical protein
MPYKLYPRHYLDGIKLTIKRNMFEILNGFGEILFTTISRTSEILKMFHYPQKIQRLYKKNCDHLLLHCLEEISNLLVRHFTLNLHGGLKINSYPEESQFVTLPWNVK